MEITKGKMTTAGVIITIILLIISIAVPVPEKDINWYDCETYVGGDAYNYIIEASLRSGQISGRTAAKAILASTAVLVIFLTVAFNVFYDIIYYQKSLSEKIQKSQEEICNNIKDFKNSIPPSAASTPSSD